MLRAGIALAAVLLVLAAGCGGSGGKGGGDLDATLSYFPADPLAVAVVRTDLDGDQWQEVDKILERVEHQNIRQLLDELAKEVGVDADDVRALLGRELTVGSATGEASAGALLAALHVTDGDRAKKLLESIDGIQEKGTSHGATLYGAGDVADLAVEGDVLLASLGENANLERALARHDGDDHLTQEQFDEANVDTDPDLLVRVYGSAATVLRAKPLDRLRGLPWFDAAQSYGGGAGFDGHDGVLDLSATTDPDELTDADLPVAPGGPAPEVLQRDRQVVAANRNQSYTTAFLFRAMERLYPDSWFVQDVQALERQTGVDFVQEVLRQFDGPSASAVTPDGGPFAARSEVSDPAALEAELRVIAPHLPGLIVGLQGLESRGEALLFLFAPDIPAAIGQKGGVTVTPPSGPGGLWRVDGIEGGPAQLWFGVLGDRFVVASSEAGARAVAEEPTGPIDGAEGAADLRVDLSQLKALVEDELHFDPGTLGELVGWIEASRERTHVHATVDLD